MRDNPCAVVEKATALFECGPERYVAEKDSGGIFFDPLQRAEFPLGLVPTSGGKAVGKTVRATLGWKFSMRTELLHYDQMSNPAMRTEWWRGGSFAGRR